MNCEQAKRIDLVLYLKKNGFQPQKIHEKNVWFLSPFRKEKTASFKVNSLKNIWYDFGEGCGGTIIDFLQKFHKCSITEVLKNLEKQNFSFHQQTKFEVAKSKHRVIKKTALNNSHLINYLQERKINLEFASKFCAQVYYSFDNINEYYAIGFKNDLGGFELRNKYFKGSIGKKAITCFKNNSNTIKVFEGFIDYLSYLTLNQNSRLKDSDYLILNSISLHKKGIEKLSNYSKIELFLDNDEKGKETTKQFKKLDNKIIIDKSGDYLKYKDLNEKLINI